MLARRKCGELLELDKVAQACGIHGQAPPGVRTIRTAAIVDTSGRCCDFDRCEVAKSGEAYFASDGHKRIAAVRAAGGDFIDAYVVEVFTRRDARAASAA